jgi:phosphate transport system permease protein
VSTVSQAGGGVRLPTVSASRRRKDKIMRALLLTGTLIALVPLVLVIYYLLKEGISSISWSFLSTDPTGSFFGDPGGIKSAILGSIEIVLIASLIAVPLGIGVALYLTEYGKNSWFANTVRYFIDVMTGVPSIVFGLFIYVVLVLSHVAGNYAGWKASIAIALLMLPIVTRSAEVVLALVPGSLREAALALGAPRWRVVTRIVLPTAVPGLVTGVLLAIARGMGETAPLLFTAFGQNATTLNPNSTMNALPLQIFNDITSPRAVVVSQAWGAALTLVVIVLILNILARLVARRAR